MGPFGTFHKNSLTILIRGPNATHANVDLPVNQRLNHNKLIVQLFEKLTSMLGLALHMLLLLGGNFKHREMAHFTLLSCGQSALYSAMLLSESGLFLPIFWRNEPDISVDL